MSQLKKTHTQKGIQPCGKDRLISIFLPKPFVSDSLKECAVNLKERDMGTRKKRNMETASRQKLGA